MLIPRSTEGARRVGAPGALVRGFGEIASKPIRCRNHCTRVRVLLIQEAHQQQILLTFSPWLIIRPGSRQAQQLALSGHAQLRVSGSMNACFASMEWL